MIDDIDVRDCTIHSLRKEVGVLMQDPFLFKGTIMEDIRYGKPDASDEECIAAAKKMVDELAPGGRFIFCTGDKVLLSASDAKAENIRAVNEFVHGYGLYY